MTLSDFEKSLRLPNKFPFPYKPEKFTSKEKVILNNFFTNTDKPVFAIYNLPQEVVGAMFSRYSRSEKSVRRLFLDEFWNPSFSVYKKANEKILDNAKERTKLFYKRVFAEFGDDSVIQMGSLHVAFEFVSQIAAKAIEDQRIGASYIEKSTRYVNFGTTIKDHFLYMEAPEIVNSKYYKEYLRWNNFAFKIYNKDLLLTMKYLRSRYPIEKQIFEKPSTKETYFFTDIKDEKERVKVENAYERTLKAKAFDIVRVFLPATTVTNLGAHFSGQSTENTINKMLISPHSEVRLLGLLALKELIIIAPNFLQNIESKYGEITREYRKNVRLSHQEISNKWITKIPKSKNPESVALVDYDENGDINLSSQIIYTGQTKTYLSKTDIVKWARKNRGKLEEIINSSIPDRSLPQYNRRHKLPRAFEHAFADVEFYMDFGIYRDLQRNRLSSTERLYLNPQGLEISKELKDKRMKTVLKDYLKLNKMTKDLNKKIFKEKEIRSSSEYVSILGNKLRFNVKANIRQWVFFSELRTVAGGHPSYRFAVQEAVRQIIKKMPYVKKLFAKVDWTPEYDLGRLKAEIATQEKLSQIKTK